MPLKWLFLLRMGKLHWSVCSKTRSIWFTVKRNIRWVKYWRNKKRSIEISECHPQPTRVDSANDIHPRRNKYLPSSNKPTNSTFLTSYNKPQNTAPLARLDKNSNSLSPLTSQKSALQNSRQGSVGYRPERRGEKFASEPAGGTKIGDREMKPTKSGYNTFDPGGLSKTR